MLSVDSDAKTSKGRALGYLTAVLYLAPANESGVINTCTYATTECMQACLFTAGRGEFDSVRIPRIAKTRLLAANRQLFLDCVRWDIRKLINTARKLGLIPVVRLNGTS